MSLENLLPYAGSHAVQSAVFALEWVEPLKTETLLDVAKLATKFKNIGFGHCTHQNTVAFEISEKVSDKSVKHEIGGICFSRLPLNDQLNTRQITLSRTNIFLAIKDYTRWDDVFSDAQSYFKILLEVVSPLRPISVIGLQYNDIFQWKSDPSELNFREIFKSGGYISEHAFNAENLWHLHHGYISNFQDPVTHEVLENVNVDVMDSHGERMIQVIGSHRANLSTPMWQIHSKNKQLMLQLFTSLHNANKVMLNSLLTDEVCRRINLISD